MRAILGSGQHGLGLLCLDTGTAERKGELLATAYRQDGVEQASRRQNVHRSNTKIGLQGLVGGLGDDLGMTDRVRAVLIHPRVQGGHIHIAYFLPLFSHGMESHRTGATPKKGVTGFQGSQQIKGSQKLRDSGLVINQSVPFTFPHFDDGVTRSEQGHAFGERGLIQFFHASIWHCIMFDTSHGITAGTAMIETPMKFVDGSGQRIVAIDKITVHEGPDKLLAPIPDMSNAIGTGSLLGKEMFLIVQPLRALSD